MPELDKRDLVLAWLVEHDIPLQPKAIYGGLIYQRNITFSYRTVQNIIGEFADAGYIERVEIDPSAGEVRPLSEEGDRRAYYVVTDAGRARLDD